jgi:hypothetical protein
MFASRPIDDSEVVCRDAAHESGRSNVGDRSGAEVGREGGEGKGEGTDSGISGANRGSKRDAAKGPCTASIAVSKV